MPAGRFCARYEHGRRGFPTDEKKPAESAIGGLFAVLLKPSRVAAQGRNPRRPHDVSLCLVLSAPGSSRLPAVRRFRLIHVVVAAVAGRRPSCLSSLGFSAIRASLVSSSVATLAAFCRAVRVTLVGSMTPALTRSSYSSVSGVVAEVALAFEHLLADDAAVLAGVLGDHRQRRAAGTQDDVVADLLVVRSGRPA